MRHTVRSIVPQRGSPGTDALLVLGSEQMEGTSRQLGNPIRLRGRRE